MPNQRDCPPSPHGSQQKTEYVPEIDGLRAIAVLAVMVYHAMPGWLPGGYAGVDIFFVISGYLITRIILVDLDRNAFSLVRFWERRARRIMPALLALLAVSGIVGWLWSTPTELRGLAIAGLASILSAANIYFWQGSGGYFALTAPEMPLLHLWSLGVEEQFYILFPLLFLVISNPRSRWLGPLLLATTAASFAFSWYTSAHHPVAGFFLPFSRAWELTAGCALAVYRTQILRMLHTRAGPMCGIALCVLFSSLLFLSDETPWPGLATLPVILATILLIALAPSAPVTSLLLAARPMVAIGLVSYGTYLWHHAALAFYRILSPTALSTAVAILILCLSLAAGAFSYRFIEVPARNSRKLPSRQFWLLLIVTFVSIFVALAWLWRSDGAPDRLPRDLQRIAAMPEIYPKRMDPCFFSPGPVTAYESACLVGLDGAIRTAIVGDSHASALAPGFEPLLKKSGTRARLLAAAGCPFIDDRFALSSIQSHCPDHTRAMLRQISQDDEIRLVVIAARWTHAFRREFYDNGEGGVELGPQDRLKPDPSRDRLFEASLKRVVDRLRESGKAVLFVYPVPEPGWNVPNYLVHQFLLGNGREMPSIDASRWRSWAAPAVAMLDRLESGPSIYRVQPAQSVCGSSRCLLGKGTQPFYFDDDHPNRAGALVMIDGVLRQNSEHDGLAALLSKAP